MAYVIWNGRILSLYSMVFGYYISWRPFGWTQWTLRLGAPRIRSFVSQYIVCGSSETDSGSWPNSILSVLPGEGFLLPARASSHGKTVRFSTEPHFGPDCVAILVSTRLLMLHMTCEIMRMLIRVYPRKSFLFFPALFNLVLFKMEFYPAHL